MKKFLLLPLFLGWFLPNVTSVHANPITFRFTSLVTGVEKAVYPDVNIGDPVVGSFVFESNTPDSNGDPQDGVYLSPGSFEAQVGRAQHLIAPLMLIEVLNRNSIDRYTVAARGEGIQLEMVLGTANLSAFSNDTLPLTPPLLSLFEFNSFQVFAEEGGVFIPKITATPLFSLQTVPFSSPIPEPSTWLLLGPGLAGIMLWRKRTASARRAFSSHRQAAVVLSKQKGICWLLKLC